MSDFKYNRISKELEERIREDRAGHVVNPYAFRNDDVIRRQMEYDKASLMRPPFVRDVEKILHLSYYNRYLDKTQVFSLYRNDDVTRRALHVQLVARIARNIGSMLNLNVELIEAIALGHDIGHTPFGHAGEWALSDLYHEHTGRYFNHNIHSARVLDRIFPLNVSLQSLDGIISHNGELLKGKCYRPKSYSDFATFDEKMEKCYLDKKAIESLVPSTLEGCVVRISDIIAYLGKDRQDAVRLKIIPDESCFEDSVIGTRNAEIINNLSVNIVENSYGKDCICMDGEFYDALKKAKQENYDIIYKNDEVSSVYKDHINPMFKKLYERLLEDAVKKDKDSYLFKHHVKYVEEIRGHYHSENVLPYREEEENNLVMDYLASMTDDYFIDLYFNLFPDDPQGIKYKGYFDNGIPE